MKNGEEIPRPENDPRTEVVVWLERTIKSSEEEGDDDVRWTAVRHLVQIQQGCLSRSALGELLRNYVHFDVMEQAGSQIDSEEVYVQEIERRLENSQDACDLLYFILHREYGPATKSPSGLAADFLSSNLNLGNLELEVYESLLDKPELIADGGMAFFVRSLQELRDCLFFDVEKYWLGLEPEVVENQERGKVIDRVVNEFDLILDLYPNLDKECRHEIQCYKEMLQNGELPDVWNLLKVFQVIEERESESGGEDLRIHTVRTADCIQALEDEDERQKMLQSLEEQSRQG